jgi:hypothetical protein
MISDVHAVCESSSPVNFIMREAFFMKPGTRCVKKEMRLILYKIIYSTIRLNQHCPQLSSVAVTRLRKSGSVWSRSSISTDASFRRAFLIVIQMFWNYLCTHIYHVQILCNNLVDRTFIHIKFIIDHSNCQTSILTNESPHKVDVCACSPRGEAFRSLFIFHLFSPVYKVFVLPKCVST